MSEDKRGAVMVISSHVIRGSVGNRAAVFALESLGFPVWAMPTVVLPWHPGHGPSTRMTFSEADFDKAIDDLIRAPWIGEVRGVLTGYFGNAAQVSAVARLIAALRENRPDLLYVCDPVIGDAGGLYVPERTAIAIRDRLVAIADIATPNRYELEWLAGRCLADLGEIAAAARGVGPRTMLVTSAPAMADSSIGNLLVGEEEIVLAEHRTVVRPPNGLGDLTAAVYLARVLGGSAPAQALQSTTATVYDILMRTAGRGGDELQLETDARSLAHPSATVSLRHL